MGLPLPKTIRWPSGDQSHTTAGHRANQSGRTVAAGVLD